MPLVIWPHTELQLKGFYVTATVPSCKKMLSLMALVALGVPVFAQQVQATARVKTQPLPAQTNCPPAANCQESDRLDNAQLFQRGATMGVMGAGAVYGTAKVSSFVKGTVNMGKVGGVPHWGPAVASVPVVGGMAAGGSVIPTTLGQVPVMGAVVTKVPVVGPVVAGPANPILVGAVAIDNYVIPKYSPCGYTKSSAVAATNDFNSPPKLRHYVNYLAPQPYSHPPIYNRGTLNTDLPADVEYIDGISQLALEDSVSMPEM